MAGILQAGVFSQRSLFFDFFIAVLIQWSWSVRAEPMLSCPDYVASHAPLLWLHSEDPYRPSDLLAHVQHTTPHLDGEKIEGLSPLDLDNLEILNAFGKRVSLTSNDDPLTHPEWILGEAPDADGRIQNSVPCVVILVEKSEVDLDAFYFYFYSYNEGPNITQVLEPLNKIVEGEKAASGMHFGNHVGDWEHNMVRFREGKPTGVYFSQHIDGAAFDWDDSSLNKTEDGRPIVYSARGSHATYPARGEQVHNAALVDYCDEGQRWDPVLSAYFYRFDPQTLALTRITPPNESTSSVQSNMTSFLHFSGYWGDFQYPDDDPRQEIIPKFGLKRFQTGPTGPRHKHLVRKGLKPDHPRRISWTEWAVDVYMMLYPCCLKGWRAWFTTGVIIAALSVAVLSVIVGVRTLRRYRGDSYKRLEMEEIPMSEWYMEEDDLLTSSDDEDGQPVGRRESRSRSGGKKV